MLEDGVRARRPGERRRDPLRDLAAPHRRRGPHAAEAEIVRFLERESGNASTTVPFGTELPEVIGMGAEAVVFGPGDIKVAHRTGEHVEMAELERAAGILAKAIETFCG